jgi:tetratricopeptide (TPR) repeat protein
VKQNLAVILLALFVGLTSSCTTLNRLNPAYASFDRGLALFNQGKFAESVPYFEEATHENPEFAKAYVYLGRAYISQSRWRAAIPPLRTAFRLSPGEAQEEIADLIIDAIFAAALNDFKSGKEPDPGRFRDTL